MSFIHRHIKKQNETNSPSVIITTYNGYVHFDGERLFSISSRFSCEGDYEQHYDRTGIVELTQSLMTLLILSGMPEPELKNILMDFFKAKEEGGQ